MCLRVLVVAHQPPAILLLYITYCQLYLRVSASHHTVSTCKVSTSDLLQSQAARCTAVRVTSRFNGRYQSLQTPNLAHIIMSDISRDAQNLVKIRFSTITWNITSLWLSVPFLSLFFLSSPTAKTEPILMHDGYAPLSWCRHVPQIQRQASMQQT